MCVTCSGESPWLLPQLSGHVLSFLKSVRIMATSDDPTQKFDASPLVQHLLEELRRKDEQLAAATANERLLLRQMTDQRRQEHVVNAAIQTRSYQELQDEVERLRETVMSLQSLVASQYEQLQATRKREGKLDTTVSTCCDTLDSVVRCVVDLVERVDGLERQSIFFPERPRQRTAPTRSEDGEQYARPYLEQQGRELVPIAERESYSVETRQGTTSEIFTQTTTTQLRVQLSQSQTISYRGRDSGFDGSSSTGMIATTCSAIQDSTDPGAQSDEKDANSHNGMVDQLPSIQGVDLSLQQTQPSQCLPPSTRPEILSHSLSLPAGLSGSELCSVQTLHTSCQEGLDLDRTDY